MALFAVVVSLLFVACGGDGSEQSGTGSDEATTTTATARDLFGHGMQADLGIYLRTDISDQEMTELISSLLHETTPDQEGEAMIGGVVRVQGEYGGKAIYVDFASSASDARIEEVIASARAEADVVEVKRDVLVGDRPLAETSGSAASDSPDSIYAVGPL